MGGYVQMLILLESFELASIHDSIRIWLDALNINVPK